MFFFSKGKKMQFILIKEKKISLVSINTEINLCNSIFTSNNGLFVVKEKYFETKDLNEYGFRIDYPTRFTTHLTSNQYVVLTSKLMEKQISFKAEFIPLGYYKGQKTPLWSLTLDFSYENPERTPNIKLINFGCSYGDITIDNNVEVELSHSGGSIYDYTTNWNLAGKNRYAAMKYLVDLLTKKITLKAS